MNCVSAPTANCTCLQPGSGPRVSPVATSACGAEGLISPHTRIAFCSRPSASQFCSVSLVISPELLQMVHRAPPSGVSRESGHLPPRFSVLLDPASVSDRTVEEPSSAGKLDHNLCSEGRIT